MSLKELVTAEDSAWDELLPLLSPFKWHLDLLEKLHLSGSRCIALFPGAQHPFACDRVHDMPLGHRQRLRVMGCGGAATLIRKLTPGSNDTYEPRASEGFRSRMMTCMSRRLASKMAATARDGVIAESQQLLAAGQRSDALRWLQRAGFLGHLPSRANLSWLLVEGKEGGAADQQTAFDLAEKGASFGCCHCQGVLAWCPLFLQP